MCLPDLTVGQKLALAITGFMVLEALALVIVSKKTVMLPYRPNGPIKTEGREYANRAMTLGGLTFAAIALLVGTFFERLQTLSNVFVVLGLSLGLFLVSYSVEVLIRIRRIYWIIQDKTLWYGFFSVVVSLTLFFQQFLPDVFPVLLIVLIALGIIHVGEVYYEIRAERPVSHKNA